MESVGCSLIGDLQGSAVSMIDTAQAKKPFLISTSLVSLGLGSERSITRHERFYLLLVLALFALLAGYTACTLPLWIDELYTLFISRLPTLPEMLRVMPTADHPPLHYLVTRFSIQIFGQTEFALRLPELLAYMAAGLLTYKITRRHGTAIESLFALSLMLGSILSILQAHTARPYGMLLAFTTLVFACWQAATLREQNRLLALCGVSLGIAGAILSHHFGVIHVGVMLGSGETARLIQRRRLDGWMLAFIAAGLTPLTLTVPMMRQSHLQLSEAIRHSPDFYGRPSLGDLAGYLLIVALPLLCLVAAFAFLPWPRQNAADCSSATRPVPAHEWAAVGALSLLLPLMILLTAIETGYFLTRYAIGSSLGLALLGGWALPRLDRLRLIAQPLLALSTLSFLLLIAAALLIENMSQPIWNAQPAAKAVSPLLLNAPGDLPIVVANVFDYAPQWWYAPPLLKQRLTYLSDLPYASQQAGGLPELQIAREQAHIPLRTSEYAAFLKSHPRFLLLESGSLRFNWTVSRLASEGWRLTQITSSNRGVLYQVDRP
jgi:4-amino-4-deoxy-L-arabinose transferase-like glycosyltransferase